MTEGIVECLEIIKVNEKQRSVIVGSCAGSKRLFQTIMQERAIGQPCQLIEESQLVDLLFGLFPLGNIGKNTGKLVRIWPKYGYVKMLA